MMNSDTCKITPPAAPRRRGVAAVEFAVILPLLILIILGIIEFGRAMMVMEMLNNSAREGARRGVLQGADDTAITTRVDNTLDSVGIPSGNVTKEIAVSTDGTTFVTANASTATTGHAIRVRLTLNFNDVSYLPRPIVLNNRTLEGVVIMRRE